MGRLVLVASILVSLVAVGGQVAATTPQDVTITQHSMRGGPSTFVAGGAIDDFGPITLDSFHASAIPSPVVGTGHFIRTYHGRAGSFTIQLQTLLTPTDVPWLWHEAGHWVLVEGTGAYAGLRGEGVESGTRDFRANTLDVVFTGQVH